MENRFLIILFIIISIIIFSVVLKNRKLKGNVLVSVLYLLVTSALIGVVGFLCNKMFFTFTYSSTFLLTAIWMLLVGIAHLLLLKMTLPWAKENEYWAEFFFTIVIALIGGIVLLLVFQFSEMAFANAIYLTTLLLFVLPYIFFGSLGKYMSIPVKILRKWQYPVDEHVEDPLDREMESPLVVGFEFKKKNNDKNMTTFRAKAPKEMVFGKLFYYFINDYNDRNPDEMIEFLNENQKPTGWIFYFKPRWFRKMRYIDPEETNSFNFVKENSVIVCKRIIEK